MDQPTGLQSVCTAVILKIYCSRQGLVTIYQSISKDFSMPK